MQRQICRLTIFISLFIAGLIFLALPAQAFFQSTLSIANAQATVGTMTTPTATLTVTSKANDQNNNLVRDIKNQIQNGNFEDGLNGWQTNGDVALINGSENNVQPFGQKMVRIGNPTGDVETEDGTEVIAPGNDVSINVLSQTISNSPHGLRSLGFWYNFQTFENMPGFDEPGMMVFVNDQMEHQIWASDIPGDNVAKDDNGFALSPKGTGWQYMMVDISGLTNPTLTIAFYAGNTGDLARQSYVYLDNITSDAAIINKNAALTLQTSTGAGSVHYHYAVGGNNVDGEGASGLTFSLTGQPDHNELEYWASDNSGKSEDHHQVQVIFDETPPTAVTDLQAEDDGVSGDATSNGHDFSLTWSAPADSDLWGSHQATAYDLRYSYEPIVADISDTDWQKLPQPTITKIDQLPGSGWRAPLSPGQMEVYQVQVQEVVGQTQDQIWFALRSSDAAQNVSALSNIASVAIAPPGPTVQITRIDDQHLQFTLTHVEHYDHYDYTLTYLRAPGGDDAEEYDSSAPVQDGMTGSGTFQEANAQTLYLGTCSSGGTCMPHQQTSNFQLQVVLHGAEYSGVEDEAIYANLE